MSIPAGSASSPPSRSAGQLFEDGAEKARRFSPGLFGVIAVCFLLPFVSLECSGRDIVTFKGLDFITGTQVKLDPEFEEAFNFDEEFGTTAPTPTPVPTEDDRLDPNIWAIIALVGAAAGAATTLALRGRSRDLAGFIAAVVVVLGLLALKFDLDGDVGEAQGVIAFRYRFGYWIAMLIAIALGIAHGLILRRQRVAGFVAPAPTSPPETPPEAVTPPPTPPPP